MLKGKEKLNSQIEVLEKYYKDCKDWSNELVEEISSQTKLSNKQVSKWLWDKKLKENNTSETKSVKSYKRTKFKEEERFEDEYGGYSVLHKKSKSEIVQPQPKEILGEQLQLVDIHKYVKQPNKDTQSVGTISMLDGIMFKNDIPDTQSIKEENASMIMDNNAKPLPDNQSQKSMNSTKTSHLKGKFSKLKGNKSLKIKTPSIDDLIK